MTSSDNINKIKFINSYGILNEIKETSDGIKEKDCDNVLRDITTAVSNKLSEYPEETYLQYRMQLLEEYKDNLEDLFDLIVKHLSDTCLKTFWVKNLRDLMREKRRRIIK